MSDQDSINEKIAEYAISKVDFYKIHCAMTALDWTYVELGGEVPTIAYLKKHCKRLVLDVLPAVGNASISSGGFFVEKFSPDRVSIKFILEQHSFIIQ